MHIGIKQTSCEDEINGQKEQLIQNKKVQILSIWDADKDNKFSAGDVKAYIEKNYTNLNNNQIKKVLDSLKEYFDKDIKYTNKLTIISLSMKVMQTIKDVISESQASSNGIVSSANNWIANVQENSKRILALAEKSGYNSNLSLKNTRVSNKYYSGNSYNIQYSGLNVKIVNNQTGKIHQMNLYLLLDQMNDNDAVKFLLNIQRQPAEVIEDLAIEMEDLLSSTGHDMHTTSNQEFVAGGYYSSGRDSIVTSPKHLVHELGHAIDYTGQINTSTTHNNKKFMATFKQELAAYKKAGNVQYNYNDSSTWKKDEEFNYCTANEKELFAESYQLAMTGHCRSENVINKYFPKTFQVALEIIKEIRQKPDLSRRYSPSRELIANITNSLRK